MNIVKKIRVWHKFNKKRKKLEDEMSLIGSIMYDTKAYKNMSETDKNILRSRSLHARKEACVLHVAEYMLITE